MKATKLLWKFASEWMVDGAKLTDARIAAQMSMDEVANALGCNKSQVSRWEQGKLFPSEERIFKMAELFGTKAFIMGNPHYRKELRTQVAKEKTTK